MWSVAGNSIKTGGRGVKSVIACMTTKEARAILADIEKMRTETGFNTPLLEKFIASLESATDDAEKKNG